MTGRIPAHRPRRRPTRRIAAALGLLLASVLGASMPIAHARTGAAPDSGCPTYRIAWSTLDSGGGRAQGPIGGWRVDATIGQSEPESAPLCTEDGGAACAGARFTLRGGFWPGRDQAPTGVDCLFADGFESPASAP